MNGGITTWIVARAKSLGFDLCGIAGAEEFPELAKTAEWLDRGYAGEMRYLHDAGRSDLQQAMGGVRSVIVCGLNYQSEKPLSTEASQIPQEEPRGWISRYAWGEDYHEVLRKRLELLRSALKDASGEGFQSRVYVDTGPVSERVLAKHAGLGWIGKNTLLLNQKIGSLFFLGVILTTLELEPTIAAGEAYSPDLCGTCRRCIEACPTEAIVEPYVMDASRCISYLTIELRGTIPEQFREAMGWHVFGCDICQDVCPWNRRAPRTSAAQFQPRVLPAQAANAEGGEAESVYMPSLERLAGISEDEFREAFRGSPIKRAKWRGIVRNACIALGNTTANTDAETKQRIRVLLARLSQSPEVVISESAQWALSRIQQAG